MYKQEVFTMIVQLHVLPVHLLLSHRLWLAKGENEASLSNEVSCSVSWEWQMWQFVCLHMSPTCVCDLTKLRKGKALKP